MPQPPSPARKAAVDLIVAVFDQSAAACRRPRRRWRGLPPPIVPRAQRLAADTLRGLERADRLLKPHLRKDPRLRVRSILRLGAVELARGGAAHGVVNDAWSCASRARRRRA